MTALTHADLAAQFGAESLNGAADADPPLLDLRVEQLRRRLLSRSALAAIPPPEPLIEGILQRDTIAALYGKPGTCKSFLLLDWALSVSTGAWWFGHKVHQGPALYVAAEGIAGLPKRTAAWEDGRNVLVSDECGMRWLPNAVNLLEPGWVEALLVVVEELRPVLIAFDTLARSMPGGDENKSPDMGRVIDAADRMRVAVGATVVLVHHTPKEGGSLRGHSSLEGAVDTAVEVRSADRVVTVVSAKQKDMPAFDDVRLVLCQVADSCVLQSHDRSHRQDELLESERALLEAVGLMAGTDGLSPAQLLTASEMPRSSFFRALKSLLERGLIANVGTAKRPRYCSASEVES